MRRLCVVPMMLCLLLCGCSGDTNELQQALDFRTKLMASNCSFAAHTEADYGDTVERFSLDCTFVGTEGTLRVTAPETLAGISARVSGGSHTLEFDGLTLEYGDLANGQVAPLSIPWLLGSAWQSDYISAAGKDGEMYAVTYRKGYDDEELEIRTWFSGAVPVAAEVSKDGRRVLAIQIENFAFISKE